MRVMRTVGQTDRNGGTVGDLTPRRARAIARVTYIFAYPLVREYVDMYRQAINISSPTYSGGFGTWRHVVAHERPKHGSGRPNEAVVYSSIWVDLRAEPWWCTMGGVPSGGGVHRPMD
jgi:hypothetical protein